MKATDAAAAQGETVFNPFEPGFFQSPYEQYHRLRTENPVCVSPLGAVIVSLYRDVYRMLFDPELQVDDREVLTPRKIMMDSFGEGVAIPPEETMARLDGDVHKRLRSLVQKGYTPRAVAGLRGYIETITDDLLDHCEAKGTFDLIADFAYPLPFQVISQMLGIPPEQRQALREAAQSIARVMDLFIQEEDVKAAVQGTREMQAFLEAIIEQKRRQPGDDVLSALVVAEEQLDRLTDRELVYMAMLIFEAGHETTVNLLGNGVVALFDHPDQLGALRNGNVPAGNAVDELLRYDSPVQLHGRVVRDPYQVGDHVLEPGTLLVGIVGSANRDPDRWGPTADDLDLGRDDAQHHVTFGWGLHRCLGAALAKLEGEVAIPALLRRFPRLALAEKPTFGDTLFFRGMKSLQMVVEP